MFWPELREPVSALTHGSWVLFALPATCLLWRRSSGDRPKQIAFLVYGASLAACFGASALCHGAVSPNLPLRTLILFDHIGIYLLIAGTYTPIAWCLLRGRWRAWTLALAWQLALLGAGVETACGTLPPPVITIFYMVMGWGCVLCYSEVARAVPRRELRSLVNGGILYSVGAAINLLKWPTLAPGVVGPHEIFHLFAMAGSLVHFSFMLRVVQPHRPAAIALSHRLPIVVWQRVSRLGRRRVPGTHRLAGVLVRLPRAGVKR